MAPPPFYPRLHMLTAEIVAVQALICVSDRASDLLDDIRDPNMDMPAWRWSETRSRLAVVAGEVTTWAQTGVGDVDRAREQAARLAEALYRPADAPEYVLRHTPPASHRSALAVVLRAASGRYRLLHGNPLPTSELAALAGVSHRRVNQMADGAGVLRRPGSEVSPYDGHELLAAFVAPADTTLRKAAAADVAGGAARWVCADGARKIRYRYGGRIAALALERVWEPGFEDETQEMELPR